MRPVRSGLQAGAIQELLCIEAPETLVDERPDALDTESIGNLFSVWNDSTSQKKDRIFYNIHALKLRELRGYAITGRDFAGDFRDRFEAMRDQWPNVRVDFGPATLMQGWIAKEEHMLGKNILLLMERFRRLSPIIDDLLTSRRR